MRTYEEQNKKAMDTLSELCKNPQSFTMRVPADEEKDTDLIIAKALAQGKEMLELLKECRDGFVMTSLIDKSSLSKDLVNKIEKITLQK